MTFWVGFLFAKRDINKILRGSINKYSETMGSEFMIPQEDQDRGGEDVC